MTARLCVTSEIYAETDFHCSKLANGKSVSRFAFVHPADIGASEQAKTDKDGDLVVTRRRKDVIEIEHHNSTDLTLVGLQVWRGALLLADYVLHHRQQFQDQQVIELGAGVGLTGIAAGLYARRVICTDINLGGILELIASNIRRNRTRLPAGNDVMGVMELDFKRNEAWSAELMEAIRQTDVFLAADVIYDDDLTDALIATIDKLLSQRSERRPGHGKTMYIALEKRYVFTVAEMESLAPCYEYFLTGIERLRQARQWRIESIPIDFPQYFEYERVRELVLLRLSAE